MGFLFSLLILPALFSLVVGFRAAGPKGGTSIPSVINNCSGTAQSHLPNQIASASGYAPQLLSYGDWWEEWVTVVEGAVNGNENPMFFARFARGDPGSPNSKLENGMFAFWTHFDNGTTYGFAANGTLEYSDVGGVKTWTLGDNKLTFDGNTGSWSHSLAHPEFSFQSRTNMYARVHVSIGVPPAHLHGHITPVPHRGRHSPRS